MEEVVDFHTSSYYQIDYVYTKKDFDGNKKNFAEPKKYFRWTKKKKNFAGSKRGFAEPKKNFTGSTKNSVETKKNFVETKKDFVEIKKDFVETKKDFANENKSSSTYQTTDKLITKMSELLITPNSVENALAIVKYFNDDRIVFASQQVLISDYVLTGINEAMEILNLPDDCYTVNILYGLKPFKNSTGDMQLCVTGTAENGEAPQWGIINELKEEMRVDVEPRCIRQLYWCENKRKDFDYTWFGCSVADLKVLPKSVEQRPVSKTQNRIKRKLSCIVYGDITQIMSFFSQKFPKADYNPHEDIDGVVCLKVSDVKNIIKLIQTKYRGSVRSKFYWYKDKPDEFVFTGSFCPRDLVGTI